MKVKAGELRLRNYVECEGETWNISRIHHTSISLERGNVPFTLDTVIKEIIPISLTEEWLLKFGFENWGKVYKDLNTIHYVLHNAIDGTSNFEIHIYNDNFIPCIDNDCCCWSEFKYVHQLQNLYFAFTGYELTII